MKQINTDFCVIGGGTSGLTAAIRARDNGIPNVVILEKRKVLGGCCPCFSMCMGINTPLQKRLGIEIDPIKVFLEHMKVQNWDCDAKLVSRWLNSSGDSIAWLESLGVQFTEVLDSGSFGDATFRMMHGAFKTNKNLGSQICKALIDRAAAVGVVSYTETHADQLILEAGRVVGVKATQNGEDIMVRARAVMVTTGSISGNIELIGQLIDPNLIKGVERIDSGMAHNTGDGFNMVREAGGKKGKFSVMYYGPHQHPYSNAVCMELRRPLVAAFNRNGERFVNESLVVDGGGYQWMSGNALQNQPGQIQYTIIDHANLRDQIDHPKFESVIESTLAMLDFESEGYKDHQIKNSQGVDYSQRQAWLEKLEADLHSEAEAGRVLIANTLDEIADWIGCEPNLFKREVEKYNQFCAQGKDEEFGKDGRHLRPISTAPYYVIKAWQGIDTVMGGITVNHKLEVLDENERAIPGLYAGGIGTSGFVGYGYGFPGTESSYCMASGFIAAEEIAKTLAMES